MVRKRKRKTSECSCANSECVLLDLLMYVDEGWKQGLPFGVDGNLLYMVNLLPHDG